MAGDEYRLLGSVAKTKGITGEVVIRTKIPAGNIKEEQRFVMVKTNGLLVPFFATSWHNVSTNEIVLKFRDVNTKDKAEDFRDKEIWLSKAEFKKSILKTAVKDISGFKVTDTKLGFIGITRGILEIPDNELLQVEYGEREVLIPLQDSIILEINPGKKQITVNLPEGFLQI